MRKLHIILSTILIGIILLFIIVNALNAEPEIKVLMSTWTKAICNEENYCIDVQITCENNKIVDIKPTGEGVYLPEDWEDPRPVEQLQKWC